MLRINLSTTKVVTLKTGSRMTLPAGLYLFDEQDLGQLELHDLAKTWIRLGDAIDDAGELLRCPAKGEKGERCTVLLEKGDDHTKHEHLASLDAGPFEEFIPEDEKGGS